MNYIEVQQMRKQASGASAAWDKVPIKNTRTFTGDMKNLGNDLVNDTKYIVNNPQQAAKDVVNDPMLRAVANPVTWWEALSPFSPRATKEREDLTQKIKQTVQPYADRWNASQQSGTFRWIPRPDKRTISNTISPARGAYETVRDTVKNNNRYLIEKLFDTFSGSGGASSPKEYQDYLNWQKLRNSIPASHYDNRLSESK